MFVVCLEHMELALDEFVDEYEEAPDVYKLTEVSFTAWEAPSTCEYCAQKPLFLVV